MSAAAKTPSARLSRAQHRDLVAALGTARRVGDLQLQINTSGAWRNVILFARADELACAHVLTAAPLLASAAGPRTTLRIVSADGQQTVLSHWDVGRGWRGTAAATAGGAGAGGLLAGVDDGPPGPRHDPWYRAGSDEVTR